MKKALILTVTAGNGHNSAANTMKQKLELAGVEVKVVDIIKEFASALSAWTIDRGYDISVGYFRHIYNGFYKKYLKYDVKRASVCPSQSTVKDINGGLLKLIYEFRPDVIYGTSFYCGMVLTNLRSVYKIPSINIVCMLDYVCSPFWESSVGGVDYLTLSHEDFRNALISKGFKNENLVYTGIPISEKFSQIIGKNEARKKLGLKENLFTVFIFYGGGHWHGGYKVLKTLVKNFKQDLQIVIVNGRDEKTKEKIDKEINTYPSNFIIKNIGYSKEVDWIMSACDVMIGKGGGLSTTESVNKELPLIATTKLPAQEVFNIKFFEEKGAALTFRNSKDLIKKVELLYNNPKVLQEMRDNLKVLKTKGCEKVFDLIMKQKEADYFGINTKLDYKKVDKIVNRARKNNYKKIKNG